MKKYFEQILITLLVYFRLLVNLDQQIERVTNEIANLESVDKSCKELHEKLNRLQKDVNKLDVWSKEQQPVAEGLKVRVHLKK